jgi:hypothetical protein
LSQKISNAAVATGIPSLSSADQDGTISSYVINSIPPASQGVLLLSGVPVSAGQVLTPAQISQLQFDPSSTFIGDAIFNYTAFDNSGNISNTATYVIPVVAPVILPANGLLLSADYRSGKTELTWRTLSESNTNHFEIERSIDNGTFLKTGANILASGNSVSEKMYNAVDDISTLQTASAIYYRVKLIDADGKSRYSNTVMIRNKTKGVFVWPTPFKEQLYISINSASNSILKTELTDVTGKMLVQRNFSLNRGSNQVTLPDLSDLPKGIYMLRLINADNSTSKSLKVMKE